MSLAEYARHRGVSKAAVTYAVRDGRITTTTDNNGKTRIDPETADRQWQVNTAHEKRRNTGEEPGVAPIGPMQVEPVKPEPEQISFLNEDLGAPLAPEKPDIKSDEEAENTYAKSRALKEHYAAKQAELEFKTRLGELIEAKEIEKEWTEAATLARSKVLGIPTKARQQMPELTHDQFLVLERICREALEDLAGKAK